MHHSVLEECSAAEVLCGAPLGGPARGRGDWRPPLAFVLPMLLALALLVGLALASPAGATAEKRWVSVSVATLWVEPGKTRIVDRPATARPVNLRKWLRDMTLRQERWLVGRLETQVLYGTPVYVLGERGRWTKIAIPSQPTPRNTWGYPGWVPTRQLTSQAPQETRALAVVRRRTARMWGDKALTQRSLLMSYGTRLRAIAWDDRVVEVVALSGVHRFVRRSEVFIKEKGVPWPALSRSALIADAKRFLGSPYLWAGTSGIMVDCSGFTRLVYSAHGKRIPRDGAPQRSVGKRIWRRSALRGGDLIFFRNSAGRIHHIGMYVGGGNMIHAPRTGKRVSTVSIWNEPYRSQFAGASRFAR